MIRPKPGLKVLEERPPVSTHGGKERLIPWLLRMVGWWWRWKRTRALKRSKELIAAASNATDRAQLEGMLGEPRYAIDGEAYRQTGAEGSPYVPQVGEVYERGTCVIEVWFVNQALARVTGFLSPSSWQW